MAIKTTRWRPDTCGCTIEFEWDDQAVEADRTHTFSRFVTQCPAHAGQSDWEGIKTENQGKNELMAVAALHVPDLDVQGPVWSFDQNRKLTLTIDGATPEQKAAIADTMATRGKPGVAEVR